MPSSRNILPSRIRVSPSLTNASVAHVGPAARRAKQITSARINASFHSGAIPTRWTNIASNQEPQNLPKSSPKDDSKLPGPTHARTQCAHDENYGLVGFSKAG